MRLGIKGKQVLGVTTIVGAVVVVLSLMNLARLAQVSLDESRARAELLANAIYHRAHDVVVDNRDPYGLLKTDRGLRSILESSFYSKNVLYAAITDAHDIAVVQADPALEDKPLEPTDDLGELLKRSPLAQLVAIYADQGRTFEYQQPLLLGDTKFGAIRIGVSTLLIRHDLDAQLQPAAAISLIALTVAVFGAMLLAQLFLRPIHVIRSGLTRLGRGEFGVRLDLNQDDEFGELGTFFNQVSQQLSADRSQMAGQVAHLESAVEHLEDAVAIVSPGGNFLFANPAMRALLPGAAAGHSLQELPSDHPIRYWFDQALASRQSKGPVSVQWRPAAEENRKADAAEVKDRQLLTHPVEDANGALVGVMIIVRDLEYLSQMQSTIRYSRKLAALGRLSAGVAHEVKNPLNAMMIHLELLRQRFVARQPAAVGAGGASTLAAAAVVDDPTAADRADALQHVDTIAGEIRRLDEVVQGFLKFTRPEDLKLQPVRLRALFDEVVPIVSPEAERRRVRLSVDCRNAPDVNGDPAMLRQAFLNLALNACQAMPDGGVLTISCESARGNRVVITFNDTGTGIKPEDLPKIFNLYFTTKPKGSGIGLSMVYRTVQMHDGEIEVQSTLGVGTTFRILLPQA
jgi:signal transduction histidine kinase